MLILILGCMTALTPFSIDMYLPAFAQIAADLNTTVTKISLSLSSYFIGLAAGQLFYGPLLDRYGRKPPLYAGLFVYIFASVGCYLASSTEMLIFMRFVQALGGCVASIASLAMVRDLFPPQEGAKVFSLLILILGASPLLAPTIGGHLTAKFGWQAVFLTLTFMAAALFVAIRWRLPESHQPDPSVSLKPLPIFKDFLEILNDRRFFIYSMSGAIMFSGLFLYLAGSSIIFIDGFGVTPEAYGWIFAIIASGMILASQLNVVLLNKWSNRQLLWSGMAGQVFVALAFFLLSRFTSVSLFSTVVMLFLYMGFFGITNPNAMSLTLAPFARNAGRASALLGFLQMTIGALSSSLVGAFNLVSLSSVIGLLALTSSLGLLILWLGRHTTLMAQDI